MEESMGRVTGLGGVFFKADDPKKLYEWYEKHLGIKEVMPGAGVVFNWKEDGDPEGCTAWSIFKPDTKYFEPSTKPFMMNFRVEGLDGLLETLRSEGVWIDPVTAQVMMTLRAAMAVGPDFRSRENDGGGPPDQAARLRRRAELSPMRVRMSFSANCRSSSILTICR